jgi:hypothetical protein
MREKGKESENPGYFRDFFALSWFFVFCIALCRFAEPSLPQDKIHTFANFRGGNDGILRSEAGENVRCNACRNRPGKRFFGCSLIRFQNTVDNFLVIIHGLMPVLFCDLHVFLLSSSLPKLPNNKNRDKQSQKHSDPGLDYDLLQHPVFFLDTFPDLLIIHHVSSPPDVFLPLLLYFAFKKLSITE